MKTFFPLRSDIFLAIILLFVSFPSWADNQSPTNKIVEPPNCTNSKGEIVVFKNIDNSNAPSAAGMANRDKDGLPVIYRFSYQKSPEALQRFIDCMNAPITKQAILICRIRLGIVRHI